MYEDFCEDPITLHPIKLETYGGARGEYGITYMGEREDASGGAALFLVDGYRMYLRLDWANWYPISTSDQANIRELMRRKTALLYYHTETGLVVEPIKVYRIDPLPDDLFTEREFEPETEDSETD